MKVIFCIAISLLSISQLFSQDNTYRIETSKRWLGTTYWYNGQVLDFKEIKGITKSNADAYKEIKVARNRNIVRSVAGIAGTGLIVWPVISHINNNDPNWNLALAGAGCIGISITYGILYSSHLNKGIEIYNKGLSTTQMKEVNIKLGTTLNGVGFVFQF